MLDKSGIRFLRLGARRVAYEIPGDGPPLVAPAWWVSHLELDWQHAGFRRFWEAAADGYALIRYDRLGVGMSDRTVQDSDLTLDGEVATLRALLDDLEPEPAMRRRLARRLQRHARVARIVDAPAERLPLADESVHTVVSTLVLCTVDDPESALREIARVLRPAGQLLFIEHVRASSRFLAACQDNLLEPWFRFAGGCRCNRPTVQLMRACGFAVAADQVVWRGMPRIVHPLVVGRATGC
jgi:SAM-dependent methyltransferase